MIKNNQCLLVCLSYLIGSLQVTESFLPALKFTLPPTSNDLRGAIQTFQNGPPPVLVRRRNNSRGSRQIISLYDGQDSPEIKPNDLDSDSDTTSTTTTMTTMTTTTGKEETGTTKESKIQEKKSSIFQTKFHFAVEDSQVLLYDIALLLNLSLSVSVWVVHRSNPIPYLTSALSEGSLLCLLWICVGLMNGMFLYSAVDGHSQYNYSNNNNNNIASEDFNSMNESGGGPKAAGLLSFNTFVSVSSLRIIWALIQAVLYHRHVGDIDAELLIPLELAFGLVLMSFWRMLHSAYVPR